MDKDDDDADDFDYGEAEIRDIQEKNVNSQVKHSKGPSIHSNKNQLFVDVNLN